MTNETPAEDLLPCPCCGGHGSVDGFVVLIDDERGRVESWGSEPCDGCDGEGWVTPSPLLVASDPTPIHPDPHAALGANVCPF